MNKRRNSSASSARCSKRSRVCADLPSNDNQTIEPTTTSDAPLFMENTLWVVHISDPQHTAEKSLYLQEIEKAGGSTQARMSKNVTHVATDSATAPSRNNTAQFLTINYLKNCLEQKQLLTPSETDFYGSHILLPLQNTDILH